MFLIFFCVAVVRSKPRFLRPPLSCLFREELNVHNRSLPPFSSCHKFSLRHYLAHARSRNYVQSTLKHASLCDINECKRSRSHAEYDF